MHGVDQVAFKNWIHKLAIAVMSRLAERFPQTDMELCKALEVFSPYKMPAAVAELANYGKDQISALSAHYAPPTLATQV